MSIFKKISILFILSLVLMSVIGFWTDNINSKRMNKLIQEKYLTIIEDIFKNIENKSYIETIFKKNNLTLLKESQTSNNEIIYTQNYTFGKTEILKEMFDDKFIIKINYLDEEYILRTPDEKNLNGKKHSKFPSFP